MPMHRQPLMRDRKPIKGLKHGDKISVTVLRKAQTVPKRSPTTAAIQEVGSRYYGTS